MRLTAVGFATISTLTDQPRPEVASPVIDLRADLISGSSWRRLSPHPSELGMGNRPHGGPETGRRRANESLSAGAANETPGMTNDGGFGPLRQVVSLWPWFPVKPQRHAAHRVWNFCTPLLGRENPRVFVRSKRHQISGVGTAFWSEFKPRPKAAQSCPHLTLKSLN